MKHNVWYEVQPKGPRLNITRQQCYESPSFITSNHKRDENFAVENIEDSSAKRMWFHFDKLLEHNQNV
jgi:hypothetical protein